MQGEVKLRTYSMFAGIAGFDIGLERTGHYQTVLFSEVEPYACRILAKHYPSVPNIGDCTTADYTNWQGRIDCITAGFPCQSISIAGKQEGIKDGTRSGLWSEVVRAICVLQPRLVILENVGAITSSNGGRDFHRVLTDLYEAGMDAQWATVRASDVGAPHQRERWFCVAYPRRNRLEGRGTEQDTASKRINEYQSDSETMEYPDNTDESSAYGGVTRAAYGGQGGYGQDYTGRVEHHGASTPDEAMEYPNSERCEEFDTTSIASEMQQWSTYADTRIFTSPPITSDYWGDAILYRGRLVKPGLPILAPRVPDRVARLKAIGNAIVPQVAEYVGREALKVLNNE